MTVDSVRGDRRDNFRWCCQEEAGVLASYNPAYDADGKVGQAGGRFAK